MCSEKLARVMNMDYKLTDVIGQITHIKIICNRQKDHMRQYSDVQCIQYTVATVLLYRATFARKSNVLNKVLLTYCN